MSARNTYRRPMTRWYTRNPVFAWYIVRELTAVFLAVYAFVLLAGLVALGRGADSYAAWLAFLSSPPAIALHGIIVVAALYNAYSWFKVSPKAMPPIRIGGRKIPDSAIIGGQYATALLISAAILVLAW
ncbi:MAG: hypothetical protein ACPG1A_15805, partial [Halioglobus sp.]